MDRKGTKADFEEIKNRLGQKLADKTHICQMRVTSCL